MQMVTANRLSDGLVVFMTETGDWSESIGDGWIAETKSEADALLAEAEQAVAACRVVAPYLIDVAREGTKVRALRYREHIRAAGPSVRSDVGSRTAEG